MPSNIIILSCADNSILGHGRVEIERKWHNTPVHVWVDGALIITNETHFEVRAFSAKNGKEIYSPTNKR